MQNHIETRAYVFMNLQKGEFIFIDTTGNIIDEVQKYPENWDTYTQEEKQQFYDNLRKKLSEKYHTEFNEKNSIIASAHTVLKDLPENTTMIEIIEKNMNTLVNDEKLTRKEHLERAFSHLTGDKDIDTFIQKHIAGIIAWESSFDHEWTKPNGNRAFGIMQLMPSIVKNNNITNPEWYSIETIYQNYPLQVEIGRRLMLSDYEAIKRYTPTIAEKYFHGDISAAKKFFIAPMLLNSYNTGRPIIENALEEFLNTYPNLQTLTTDMWLEYKNHPELDIFWMFTYHSAHNGNAKNYGNDASRYIQKWMALSQAIHNSSNTTEE